MKKLVLVDGNAIVHRAYHALPPLSKKDGKLTNAVYGFFAMVLKIVSDINPDALIICFDRPAPNFRQQLYAGYQATRPKMENDLSYQFELIREVLLKANIKIFELDGYEADDLIGTLSHQAVDKKIFDQSIIVSGDRDLLQLVNHHVLVLAPIVGVTKMILFDSDKIREKYGLDPKQIVDYKALVGDASDNYPGVAGIGPKTAVDLISKFGSLEGIYSSLSEINPKTAEKLANDAEQSALAKKLATIDVNAPIHLKFEDCSLAKLDRKALLASFEDLSFNSLINRFKLDAKPKVEKSKKTEPNKDQLGLL